jgi:hypothetical protein
MPWLMLATIIVILWPSNPLGVPGREMFASGMFTASLAILAFTRLMQLIPDTFDGLHRRQLIALKGAEPPDPSPTAWQHPDRADQKPDPALLAVYNRYALDIENMLNGRGQWGAVGVCLALVIGWVVFGFAGDVVRRPILLVGLIVQCLIACVIGVSAWRMVVVGVQVGLIPRRFDLRPQFTHPDRCGGLQPIGNLCLWNALIAATAGIFLGGWLAIGPHTVFRDLALRYEQTFRWLLLVPICVSTVSFFLPLWGIHRAMAQGKAKALLRFEDLALSIDAEARRLVLVAKTLEAEEGERRANRLAMMRRVYGENARMPEWPINVELLTKFASAQTVPVLSLLGVAQPIVDLVTSLLSSVSTGPAG